MSQLFVWVKFSGFFFSDNSLVRFRNKEHLVIEENIIVWLEIRVLVGDVPTSCHAHIVRIMMKRLKKRRFEEDYLCG